MATSVLLVETRAEVEAFRARRLDGIWVASGVTAAAALDESGTSYESADDLYTPDEIADICTRGHAAIRRLCDRLDGQLREASPSLAQFAMRPLLFHADALFRLCDGLRRLSLILRRLTESYPGARIHVRASPKPIFRPPAFCFRRGDALWSHMALVDEWRKSLVLEEVAGEAPEHKTIHALRSAIRARIMRSPLATTLAERLRHGGTFDFFRAGRSLLLLGPGFEWTAVIEDLRRLGLGVIHARDEYFATTTAPPEPGEVAAADRLLSSDPDFADAFGAAGVSLYPVLRDRLAWVVATAERLCLFAAERFLTFRSRHGTCAVLTAVVSPVTYAVRQTAIQSGIPVLVWQHGMVGYNGTMTQFADYADRVAATVTLARGEMSARAYATHAHATDAFSSTVVPVGSASLDRIRSSRRPGPPRPKPRVLFATTNYFQHRWYYGMPPGPSDVRMYRDQRAIVDTLARLAAEGRMDLVVKLHPSDEYDPPPWSVALSQASGVSVVKTERSYGDLLAESDAVVLDLPSTTVSQAIAAGLPVFVLLAHWHYSKDTRGLLERRVFCGDSGHEIAVAIEEFVRSGRFDRDLGDEAFLRACGTHLGDGASAARAVRVVEDALRAAARTSTAIPVVCSQESSIQ